MCKSLIEKLAGRISIVIIYHNLHSCIDMKLMKYFLPLVGYANEVGEAFRALTPLWFVRSTYGVASAYVIADTYDKSTKMSKVNN